MIKKIFSKIILFPFLFPIIYQIKFPIKNLGSINLLDLVLLLSIVLGLILIYQEKNWQNFKKYLSANRLLITTGLFLFFGLFSLIVNFETNGLKNLSLFKSYFILPIFFTIITKYSLKSTKLSRWSFSYCYLIYSSVLAFLTIIFRLIGQQTYDGRIHLFFNSPNQLAIALSLGIISGVIIYFYKNPKKFLLLILLILFIALLLTKSAGAILAVFLTIPFFYNKKSLSRLKLFLKFIIFLSVLLIGLSFFLSSFLNKINYNPFLNRNSLDSRLVIQLSAQKIISNNFLTGIGLANFQNKYLEEQSDFPPYPQWAVPHSHNLFNQIWLSFGFFGFLIWIYLLFQKTTSPKNLLGEVAVYFLLYFLIHGLVDVPIWNNDQAFFFWFIFFL